jgi:hypothetical protein
MPQIVRLANFGAAPFCGWKRVTVDKLPKHPAGHIPRASDPNAAAEFAEPAARYVVGNPCGLELWALDLHVSLAPGQEIALDLDQAVEAPFILEPLPADPLAHFGGPMTLAGNQATLVSLEPDGAGYVVCLRAGTGRMLGAHVWALWYPDQPAVAHGEAVLVASNPSVTDLTETAPTDIKLAFGDALVWIPGVGVGGRLLAAGQTLADGQGRAIPLTFVWLRHLRTGADLSTAAASVDLAVCGVGVQQLLPEGDPLMPIGFSGRAWARRHWPAAVAELHTRTASQIGPKPRSNDSGGFESQTYHVGGEAMVADGVGAETVRWLSAIRSHAARPSNHLEADGRPLSIEQHPQLVFWDGRRHWHSGVSPDRLGKVRDLSLEESAGWWGPDVQHHYAGDLAVSARLRWSPVAQWLLERHATIYLLQRTAAPGWSTTGIGSAREVALEADLVLHLHRTLKDRTIADRVVARWRHRMVNVFVPMLEGRDLVRIWDRDPRVNASGLGAQWWQESFAAAAVWRTCAVLGPIQAIPACERIARRVLDTAWHLDADGSYRAQPQGPIDGSANDANPATHSFDGYGMPLCVWLVLKIEPSNAKAKAIWAQLMAAPGETARRWMLPLEVR